MHKFQRDKPVALACAQSSKLSTFDFKNPQLENIVLNPRENKRTTTSCHPLAMDPVSYGVDLRTVSLVAP